MELHKYESKGEIPSPLRITSQLDDEEEEDPSLSSDNSPDSDIFPSKRSEFMCKSFMFPKFYKLKKFNFVEMVNSIPQPHQRANMVCYVCDDTRMFRNIGDSESSKSIVAQTSWIISVFEVACEGCCLYTLVVQAVAALGNHFQDPHFDVCLQVKDIDDQEVFNNPEPVHTTNCGLSLPFMTAAQEISNSLPESLQTAKSWVATSETHRKFNLGYIGSLKMPTRVIDVGTSNISVKLIETKNITGRFAALSYCWGDSSILEDTNLTQAKLSVYKKRIPMDSLPKTLFDAVMITRDSLEDWQIESFRMSDVSMSAFLVLAATEARDSNGGIYLGNRTTSLQLPYLDADDRQQFLYARRIQDQFHVHNANGRLESHGLYDSVLRKRGWVLQEQVLARRTLSFAKDEIL
ncbi:hypothetical protein EAF00_005274 [Botryotinia globosa]|nr:hypothetical protein EAF00_005274 [Botryotinia globosa]